MKGKLIKLEKQPSKYGGFQWFMCFKLDDGHSAKSYVFERSANFNRWRPHIMPFQSELKAGREVWLDKLQWWRGPSSHIIDGDSLFEVLKAPPISEALL